MLKSKPGKEVVVKVRNQIGVLAQLSKIISDKGISILAASAWVEAADGVIHLVTEDNLRAMDVLRQKNYKPAEIDVVMVEIPHKPGMLSRITEKRAQEGIDISYLYGTATADQDRCLIVFSSAKNE